MTGLVAAVIVAAGRGERAGGGVPKAISRHCRRADDPADAARVSRSMRAIGLVQPVIGDADDETFRAATAD